MLSPQLSCVRNRCFMHFNNKMECMFSVASQNDNPESLDIKTFVFFDTETTGLPVEEHNKTKITELSLVAVEADHIRLGVFPRVQNKLNLCFNPRKMVSIDSGKLTGSLIVLLESFNNESSFKVNELFDC